MTWRASSIAAMGSHASSPSLACRCTPRHIFITHHHSDHNADYGNLLLLAWTAGLRTPVDTWGPPPLEKMTQLFFEMNAYDISPVQVEPN